MAIGTRWTRCAVALGCALLPAAAGASADQASTATVARFLARTAILFQIGIGVAEASARGSATVDPMTIKLDAAYPGLGEAVILAAMADARATASPFTRATIIAAQDKVRARLRPGQIAQLAVMVQPVVTYLDARRDAAPADAGTPKAALLTAEYDAAVKESEKRSARLTGERGGRATLDSLRALRRSLAASQAAAITALACHAAKAGRTAGAAYLKGQGAPEATVAEFVAQPASPAIPFDRACAKGAPSA